MVDTSGRVDTKVNTNAFICIYQSSRDQRVPDANTRQLAEKMFNHTNRNPVFT